MQNKAAIGHIAAHRTAANPPPVIMSASTMCLQRADKQPTRVYAPQQPDGKRPTSTKVNDQHRRQQDNKKPLKERRSKQTKQKQRKYRGVQKAKKQPKIKHAKAEWVTQ